MVMMLSKLFSKAATSVRRRNFSTGAAKQADFTHAVGTWPYSRFIKSIDTAGRSSVLGP